MRTMTAICAGLAVSLGLGGCLFLQSEAELTLRNVSDSANILEVHVKGPDDEEFSDNVLNAQLAPGNSTRLNLPAPRMGENADGVEYEVRVRYEIMDIFEPSDVAVFRCVHAGDRFEWQWSPGSTPDRCVD